MRRKLAALTTILSLALLAGCVSPEAYRFERTILQPNTHVSSDGGVSVDILNVKRSGSCKIQPVAGSRISGRFVHVGLAGTPALRLRLEAGYLSSLNDRGLQSALRSALFIWLEASGVSSCLSILDAARDPDTTVDYIARQLYAQRPLTADAAVFTWYGPGVPNQDWPRPSRLVILRPGMQVCAHDIVEPRSDGGGEQSAEEASAPAVTTPSAIAATSRIYAIGGSICSWTTDGPRGLQFSPAVGALDTPLIGQPDWGEKPGYKQVTSWGELQRPDASSKFYLFAIIHASELPDTMPPPDTGYYNIKGSFLVRVDLSKPITLSASDCTQDGQPSRTCWGIEALQLATRGGVDRGLCGPDNVAAVTCIAFGRRTTFTAEFPVTVNGSRTLVPVGARLSAIAAQVAPDFLGPESASLASAALTGGDRDRQRRSLDKVKLQRWFDGRRVRVRLAGDIASFPLQPGDIITW